MIRGAVEISFDDQVICTLNPENMCHECTPRRAGIEVPVGRAPIDGHSTHPSSPWKESPWTCVSQVLRPGYIPGPMRSPRTKKGTPKSLGWYNCFLSWKRSSTSRRLKIKYTERIQISIHVYANFEDNCTYLVLKVFVILKNLAFWSLTTLS